MRHFQPQFLPSPPPPHVGSHHCRPHACWRAPDRVEIASELWMCLSYLLIHEGNHSDPGTGSDRPTVSIFWQAVETMEGMRVEHDFKLLLPIMGNQPHIRRMANELREVLITLENQDRDSEIFDLVRNIIDPVVNNPGTQTDCIGLRGEIGCEKAGKRITDNANSIWIHTGLRSQGCQAIGHSLFKDVHPGSIVENPNKFYIPIIRGPRNIPFCGKVLGIGILAGYIMDSLR